MCQRGEFHVKDVHIHPTKGGEGGGVRGRGEGVSQKPSCFTESMNQTKLEFPVAFGWRYLN